MCCIIHREVGKDKIKTEYLEMILKINSDGWGCSYVTDKNKIITRKSMDMSKAIEYIRTLEKRDVEFIFHARYTTLGKTDVLNCHPFEIKDGVMFHNGQIKGTYLRRKFSDSWHFAITIKNYMQNRKWKIPTILEKFKERIGESRFAFLLNDGTIIKHGKWHEYGGIHYSKNNWYFRLSNKSQSSGSTQYSGGYSGYSMYEYMEMDEYSEYDYQKGFSEKSKGQAGIKPPLISEFEKAVSACQRNYITNVHIVNLTTSQLCLLIKDYHKQMLDFFLRESRGHIY